MRLAAAAVVAVTAAMALAGAAEARVVVHTARPGDTVQSIAAAYYGNRALAPVIAAENGLVGGKRVRPGQRIKVPTVTEYRVRKGDEMESVAAQQLGDRRRASWLAQWNGLKPGERPKDGMQLRVPHQLSHKAEAPESLASVARTYLSDPAQGKMLMAYNFRSSPMLSKGEKVVVPILTRVRAVRLQAATAAKTAAAQATEEQKREAELARRVAARLEHAEKDYREAREVLVVGDLPARAAGGLRLPVAGVDEDQV